MPGKMSKKYGPQKGVFEGKTSPGPTGNVLGIKDKMPPAAKREGGSFKAGPNDELPVKLGKRGKMY